ncbi:MAG: hypothetical protein IT359_18740 [Gemmatimonadaceae bacterium]|nr:hypothetical protein [Gemmatimonadaceae bacterium]
MSTIPDCLATLPRTVTATMEPIDPVGDDDAVAPFESLRPRARRVVLQHRPTLAPTIAPLGVERRISVRHVGDEAVCVRGKVTGREYVFAVGEVRDIPLSDARHLVTEENFAFVGGR